MAPNRAAELERMDLSKRFGRVIRGSGQARTDDVAATANTVFSAGIFVRRDCRRVLLAQDDNGDLIAHSASALSSAGPNCTGPLPTWSERECDPEDICVSVDATDDPNVSGGTALFTAVAGRTYRITASGTWAQDPGGEFRAGPNGSSVLTAPIGGSGIFTGVVAWGQFWVKFPGVAWEFAGDKLIKTAASAGAVVGAFADQDTLYGNNLGYMFVAIKEL